MARKMKTAQDLLSMTEKELRRLYSWRSYEARKKLKRLEEKYGSDSRIVSDMRDRFKPLKEMGELSHRQLAQAAARTYDFGGSKTGQTYENVADKLRGAGFEKVTDQNVRATLDFLDDARARGLASIYGSEGMVEAANRAARQGLNMEEWRKNVDYWIEQAGKRKGKRPAAPRLQKRFRSGSSSGYRKG